MFFCRYSLINSIIGHLAARHNELQWKWIFADLFYHPQSIESRFGSWLPRNVSKWTAKHLLQAEKERCRSIATTAYRWSIRPFLNNRLLYCIQRYLVAILPTRQSVNEITD